VGSDIANSLTDIIPNDQYQELYRDIEQLGYNTLGYFLKDWERYKHIPLRVLAHSTHVCGTVVMENGVEKPNMKVSLASKTSAEDCSRLNLGYLDPAKIDIHDFEGRLDKGVLVVPRAG